MIPRTLRTLILLLRNENTPIFASNHALRLIATLASSIPLEESRGRCAPARTRHPFDEIPHRNAVADSNRLLFDCARRGLLREALEHFLDIRRPRGLVGGAVFSCVLKVCGTVPDRVLGEQLHCVCVKCGYDRADVSVGTSLVDLYMNCGDISGGRRVFEWMPERNVITWTSLLTGYVHGGAHDDALALFFRMRAEGFRPNSFTFATVLSAAASNGALDDGRRVHAQAVKFGCRPAVPVCNSLVTMYSKCGLIAEAEAVFRDMERRDTVSWNALMAGLVLNGSDIEALQLFNESRAAKPMVKLTQSSYSTVIKLCANLKQLALARQLQGCAVKHGFGSHSNVMTALMAVYSKCGELDNAVDVFSSMPGTRNVVSWTAMIGGYIQNGGIPRAAALFGEMRKDGVEPNEFTYSTLLTASPAISPLQIHAQVIKAYCLHVPSVGTALLASYSKLGNTREALSVFRLIGEKDVVAWSAMLACYSQAGDCEGAVRLFTEMARQAVRPNEFTLSSAIDASACPTAGADHGKQFHAVSIKYRYHDAICVSSALVTMYARKGSIESALTVFKRQPERDLVSWNSMLSGYAQHGYGKKALEMFQEMVTRGVRMDGVTFLAVIMACTHAGLVEEGHRYFDAMVSDHLIGPTMEHYACMVDLYGRAGRLERALDLIGGMPFPAGTTVWRTLLGACRVHKNVEIGKLAAEKLMSLEPLDSASYVLLSNTYAAAGRWQERDAVRQLMDSRKVKKEAGCSWIQIKNTVHSFMASDKSHPLSDWIHAELEAMTARLKRAGYRPDTGCVLWDMGEEQKETMLAQHSERLALALGMIATAPGTPLQIMKNLRLCGDCHTVMKMASALEGRKIVVRDANRFHHFTAGSCTCGDYW